MVQYIHIGDRQELSYLEELDINKPGQDTITLIPSTVDKQWDKLGAKNASQQNKRAPILVNTLEEDRKKFEQRNQTIRGKPYAYEQFVVYYNTARNIFRTYAHCLLLHYRNKRYTNPYYKINAIISNKMQEEIMIDFSIKEAIYINKIYLEYNKEIVYFDKIYQANY